MALDPASLPDDVDALKRMIVGMARDAVHANTLIEKLRGELARLRRAQFGVSSEKLDTSNYRADGGLLESSAEC